MQALAESSLALFHIDAAGQFNSRSEAFAQLVQAVFGAETAHPELGRSELGQDLCTLGVHTQREELLRSAAAGPRVCELSLSRAGATRSVSALLWIEASEQNASESSAPAQVLLQGIVLRSSPAIDVESARALHTELEFTTKVAGALAHDFNNLLTVVMSVGELMLLSGELGAGLTQRTRTLIAATQRAACLATQLSHLTRKPKPPPHKVPSQKLVKDVLHLLWQLSPELEIKTSFEDDQGMLHLDLEPLTQVLIQLILHLRDSLPTEPQVALTMRRVFLAEGLAKALAPGAYSEIALFPGTAQASAPSDIATQLMSMAEPPGRRSGLGLTSAQDIVAHAGGYMALVSQDQADPLFVVYLPLCEP